MLAFIVTIFLGAFLLFQVQPLIGKWILPWFGGTPAVWTTCMLFFQVLLLGGYAYVHATTVALSKRNQARLHLVLLGLSLLLLPIMRSAEAWKPTGSEQPTLRILILLMLGIGGPYFLLSTTSPLLQRWYHLGSSGRTPWRLYSLSNTGSLLALITYPIVVEPTLRLHVQGWVWTSLYAVFVLVCGYCGVRLLRTKPGGQAENGEIELAVATPAVEEETPAASDDDSDEAEARPGIGRVLLWLGLSACGSLVLLATTNQLCQEVAVVPFLWVLPLALYLGTFIICFDNPRWYCREVFAGLLVVVLAASIYILFYTQHVRLQTVIYAYAGTLFVACMVCHGELVRLRPSPRHLTLFYLLISLGGALGGVFVVLIAPMLFTGYWEFHLALALTVLLAGVAYLQDRSTTRGTINIGLSAGCALTFVVVGWLLLSHIAAFRMGVVDSSRNFYGVLRVNHQSQGGYYGLTMKHGVTQHGFQFTTPGMEHRLTTFYGPGTGVELAIVRHPRRVSPGNPGKSGMRIGVIGLGVGTVAGYGREGDTIRYYEINPEVIRMCREHFTFIEQAESRGATVEIVEGDARIMMEQELDRREPQKFDVLVVDAFNSDAIPMHLLTLEAAEVYRSHLAEGGIMAFHISNRYLNLFPVLGALAQRVKAIPLYVPTPYPQLGVQHCEWVLITTNQEFLNDPEVKKMVYRWPAFGFPFIAWTDDYGSLWQVMKK